MFKIPFWVFVCVFVLNFYQLLHMFYYLFSMNIKTKQFLTLRYWNCCALMLMQTFLYY